MPGTSRLSRAAGPAALIIAVLALAVALGVGSAVAAGQIGTAQIKNNAVTGVKVRNGTLTAADLSRGTVSAFQNRPAYWAYVTQSGAVGRGSPGVTGESQLNGGFWQYRITFPRDVSRCGYQVSSGDSAALGTNEFVIPARIGVARSNQSPRTLVVNVFEFNNGTSIQDTFFIAVTC